MTLGRWFLAWMLVVTTLTLGLSVAVVTIQEQRALISQLRDRAEAVSRVVAFDHREASLAIAALPECVTASVVVDGDVIWSFGPAPERALSLDPSLIFIQEDIVGGKFQEAPAIVTMLLSTSGIRNQVLAAGARLSATLAIALAVTLLVGVLLVNRVLEPILELSDQVRSFGADSDQKVIVPGSGAVEVVELATTFRALISRLIDQRTALEDKERRFRGLFLSSPIPLFEIDGSYCIHGANPAAESLVDDSLTASTGRNLGDFLSFPNDGEALTLPADDGEERVTEAGWRLPTGDRAEVELRCRKVSNDQSPRFLLAVHDLTDRVRQMAERWRLTFNEMSDGVALLDADGTPVQFNRAIEDHLEAILSDLKEIIPSTRRSEWQSSVDDRILRNVLIRTENQDRRILVSQDVTDWIKAEERLREAQKMGAVATLAGGIAHDFNNLLAGILLHLRLLERAPDAREEAIDAIRMLAEQGSEVVRGLLDFAHPERSPRKLVDLKEIVGDQEPMLRHLMPPTIELITDLKPAMILASSSDLRRLLMNLVLNARAALDPEGGRITITVGSESGLGELNVIDNGPGIPVDEYERIFEPFFTRRKEGRGAGIGLAVVYAIVREHEGEISAGEAAGGGAHFRVEFSLADRTNDQVALSENGQAANDWKAADGSRVLFVEDEHLVAIRLAEEFTIAGYEVRCANNQASAREICEVFSPDIMVVDLLLPDGRGDDLVRELRERLGMVPVVFYTGTLAGEREALAALPSSHVLEKPSSVEKLLAEVARVLG